MNSSLLDKIGIDPAIILIILLVLVIVLFGLVFYLMANIKKRNKRVELDTVSYTHLTLPTT